MKNIVVCKKDGEINYNTVENGTVDSKEFGKLLRDGIKHLCSDCANCNPALCQKVEDIEKNTIDKYDFISDGIQAYDGEGIMQYFFVSKCQNFEKDKERVRPKTKEELQRLRMLKESIKINYFGAENIEEADRIQSDLVKRKQIYFGIQRNIK